MDERIRDAFGSIHADEELKLRTVEAVRSAERPVPRRRMLPRLAAALCCIAIIVAAAVSFAPTVPAAAISLDGDISVQLGVSSSGEVLTVETYGAELGCDPVGLDYRDAVALILESGAFAESDIGISAASADAELLCGIAGELTGRFGHCRSLSSEELEAAEEAGISVGKYRACIELMELDPELSLDEACGMTMGQIREHAASCSGHASNGGHHHGWK